MICITTNLVLFNVKIYVSEHIYYSKKCLKITKRSCLYISYYYQIDLCIFLLIWIGNNFSQDLLRSIKTRLHTDVLLSIFSCLLAFWHLFRLPIFFLNGRKTLILNLPPKFSNYKRRILAGNLNHWKIIFYWNIWQQCKRIIKKKKTN